MLKNTDSLVNRFIILLTLLIMGIFHIQTANASENYQVTADYSHTCALDDSGVVC